MKYQLIACFVVLYCVSSYHALPAVARDDASNESSNSEANTPVSAAVIASSNQSIKNGQEVEEITYDQRQNGTQNVRIHLDDVTLLVAPSESLLSLFATQQVAAAYAGNVAAQSSNLQNSTAITHKDDEEKPSESATEETESAKPNEEEENKPAAALDPYVDFNELINAADLLKKAAGKGHLKQIAAGQQGAKRKDQTKSH